MTGPKPSPRGTSGPYAPRMPSLPLHRRARRGGAAVLLVLALTVLLGAQGSPVAAQLAGSVAATSDAALDATATTAAPSGRVFWVATNGSDANPGTAAAPWKDLRASMQKLRAGDTLFVKRGHYASPTSYVIRPNALAAGTPDKRITVQAADDQVFLDEPLAIDNAQYWTFDGFNITGNGARYRDTTEPPGYLVQFVGGTGWILRNSKICCFGSYGMVHVWGQPKDWTISHNTIWSNPGRGATADTDHLIYVHPNTGSGPGYIERNVLAGSSNGSNIKLGASSQTTANAGTSGITIRRNTFLGAWTNVRLAFEASGSLIEDNIMLGATRDWPDGPASVQPYCLDGRGNVTRTDLWYGPPTRRHTDPIRGTYCRYSGQWTDQGGHVKRDPRLPVSTNAVYNQRSLSSLDESQFLPQDVPARSYGRFSQFDQVLTGDWDGDGVDTPAGVLGNRVHLTDEASDAGSVAGVTPGSGESERIVTFGKVGWRYVAGDWDGDGTDELGAFDPATATFHLRTQAGRVGSFAFGSRSRTYEPIAGDWNGDGKDEVGLLDTRSKVFAIRTSATTATSFQFGSTSAPYQVTTGDWDGDGKDEVGMWRVSNRTFALRHCVTATCDRAPTGIVMGSQALAPYYQPIAGTWERGQRTDTIGVVLWTQWLRARENANPTTYLPARNYEG